MVGSTITGCRPDFANITSIIYNLTADNPSPSFVPGLLQGQCVSPLFSNLPLLQVRPPSKPKPE